MEKIRLGNDFILKLILYKVDNQLVLDNDGNPISGTPEDLTNAKNITLKLYNLNYRKEYNIVKSININTIQSEVLSNIQQIGKHYVLLEYDKDNLEFESGYQHFKIGLYSFEILSQNSNIETVDQVILYSCVNSGSGSENIDLSEYVKIVDMNNTLLEYSKLSDLSIKVDKITGKGLSANDYTTEEKNKLFGISENANLYIHPTNHSPSIIIEDSNNRFVSDNEKNIWNNKQNSIGFTPENIENKNIANGYAGLDFNGKLLETQMPSAFVKSVSGKIGNVELIKDDVGLSKVDNTSDLSKNVASALKLTYPITINGISFDGSTSINITDSTKQPLIQVGSTSDYYRGDKTWQPLNKSSIGLNNVENTSLSSWIGTSNISTVGNIINGTWSGDVISIEKGGTGLSNIGQPNQVLKVNSTGTALEYATTSESSSGTVTSIDMSVPLGLSVSGNPITTSGTIDITLTDGYSIPTTAKQSNWDTAYGWGNHSGLYKLISYNPSWSEISDKPTTLSGYGITDAQPFDSDLIAISSLSGNSGLLKKTAVDTWSLDTNTYLTSITKKQIEDVLTGSITSHTHDYQTADNDLTAISGLSGTGLLKKTGIDTWVFDSSSYLTSNQTITISGDASGSGANSINITLNTIPVTKGGTGLTSFGSSLQVLRTNSDATGLEWATDAAGLTFLGQQYGVVFADTSVSISSTSPGTSGYLLKSNQTSAPTWIDPSTLSVAQATKFYSDTTTGEGSYFIPFLTNVDNGYTDCKKSSNFYYNPSTNKLTVGSYGGTWDGSAISTSYGGTGLTTLGTAGQVLRVNTGATGLEYFTPEASGSTGTVTSISMTVPTGLTVTGSPITTTGTFALTFTSGYSIPTTTKQTNWDTAATNIASVLPIINRENTAYGIVTAITGMTNVARLFYAELSASTTLGFAELPTPGKDIHIIIKNTGASSITITIPNTGNYVSVSGTSLVIAAGGFGEINTLCYGTSKYLIRAI